MTSTLAVSVAVDGRSSRGTRWDEYGYREPGEKRCSMKFERGGTIGAQFADYVRDQIFAFAT